MREIKILKKALLAGGDGAQTLATNGRIHAQMLKTIRAELRGQ